MLDLGAGGPDHGDGDADDVYECRHEAAAEGHPWGPRAGRRHGEAPVRGEYFRSVMRQAWQLWIYMLNIYVVNYIW